MTTPDAASIAKVSLIRTGAVTHFFDQNERYLPLNFQQESGTLTVTAPVNANLAPPGYYMLFIINARACRRLRRLYTRGELASLHRISLA